jgi:hypothetical protein
MVDAVDEAVRPYLLIQDLLEPLAASSAVTGLRCVFGTRRGGDGQLLKAFGDSVTVYDLDAPEYASGADVAGYVRRTLLAEADPQVRTPYRDRPDLAGPVADAVALRAGTSFLVAQLTALALMAAPDPIDTAGARVPESFPAGVGAAMEPIPARGRAGRSLGAGPAGGPGLDRTHTRRHRHRIRTAEDDASPRAVAA